jgi:hypothetical protein
MKKIDWNNVQEAKDFERVPPMGYICEITAVEDVPEKEYLRIEYDIAHGDFRGYYRQLYASKNFWGGNFIRSYKETAQSFFKSFLTAVKESNPGYIFNDDERSLRGKKIGLVLAEEEYTKSTGDIGTRLYVAETRSIAKIIAGDYKIPDKKKLPGQAESPKFTPVADDDDGELPF